MHKLKLVLTPLLKANISFLTTYVHMHLYLVHIPKVVHSMSVAYHCIKFTNDLQSFICNNG